MCSIFPLNGINKQKQIQDFFNLQRSRASQYDLNKPIGVLKIEKVPIHLKRQNGYRIQENKCYETSKNMIDKQLEQLSNNHSVLFLKTENSKKNNKNILPEIRTRGRYSTQKIQNQKISNVQQSIKLRSNTEQQDSQYQHQFQTKKNFFPDIPNRLNIEQSIKLRSTTEHQDSQQQLESTKQKILLPDINKFDNPRKRFQMEVSTVSDDLSDDSQDSFEIWNEEEVRVRQINLNMEYFSEQEKFGKMYQIRSDLYCEQNGEKLNKQTFRTNLTKLLSQKSIQDIDKKIEEATRFIDENKDYAQVKNNSLNFLQFVFYAKEMKNGLRKHE